MPLGKDPIDPRDAFLAGHGALGRSAAGAAAAGGSDLSTDYDTDETFTDDEPTEPLTSPVQAVIERLGLTISVDKPNTPNASLRICDPKVIQAKIKSGKIEHVIKLDYDCTITAKHSSKVEKLGFDAMQANTLEIGITDEDIIKSILRLALRDDVLLVVNSNHPFAFAPLDTIAKLLSDEPKKDKILQNIAVVTGTPSSVLGVELYDDALKETDTCLKAIQQALSASLLRSTNSRHQYPMCKVNKRAMLLTFLTQMGFDLETPLAKKIKLYTVDDSREELGGDIDAFRDHFTLEHMTTDPVADLVKGGQFPQSVLLLADPDFSATPAHLEVDSMSSAAGAPRATAAESGAGASDAAARSSAGALGAAAGSGAGALGADVGAGAGAVDAAAGTDAGSSVGALGADAGAGALGAAADDSRDPTLSGRAHVGAMDSAAGAPRAAAGSAGLPRFSLLAPPPSRASGPHSPTAGEKSDASLKQ